MNLKTLFLQGRLMNSVLLNVKWNGYVEGTDFRQNFVEFTGINSHIPPGNYCPMEFKNFLDFIRDEDRQNNVWTTARFQATCRKQNLNIGYYDNISVYLRFIAERNTALNLYKNHSFHYGNPKQLVLKKLL